MGTLLIELYVPYGNVPLWDISVYRTEDTSKMGIVGLCLHEAEPSRPTRFSYIPLSSPLGGKQ